MNDTHPTVAVAELMRILLDEEGLGWDEAWEITTKTCAYTNHTIMAEALEKWPIELFSRLLPRIYQIIEEINRRFVEEIQQPVSGQIEGKVKTDGHHLMDGQVKMAHLAIVAGYSVNGVARLHTEILKHQELKDFYEMMPEKFNNKTNGITQRRFLLHGNPLLADWVTDKLGTKDWITDLSLMKGLKKWADDKEALQEFMDIKYQNKERLADYIRKHNGIELDPRSIFDVQVKRLHEYKRQLLNILHVMYLYNEIKEHPEMELLSQNLYLRRQGGGRLCAGETDHQADQFRGGRDQQRPQHQRQAEGGIYRGLPGIQRGAYLRGGGCERADLHRFQGGLRNRQYEVHAQRRSHPGNHGRGKCGDRGRGWPGERVYLRPQLQMKSSTLSRMAGMTQGRSTTTIPRSAG